MREVLELGVLAQGVEVEVEEQGVLELGVVELEQEVEEVAHALEQEVAHALEQEVVEVLELGVVEVLELGVVLQEHKALLLHRTGIYSVFCSTFYNPSIRFIENNLD
jgi:hypothetical protein